MEVDFHVVSQNLPALASGLLITLFAVVLSLTAAVLIGLLACAGNLLTGGLTKWVCRLYVDLFRAIPDVVLIFWVYFCLPPLFGLRLSALTCGVIALSLGSGAYLAEIFRAGIQAIPRGQIEAATSLALPVF